MNNNDLLKNLEERWIEVLRAKASQYEHPDRKDGKIVTSPDLDEISNEMRAFFVGLNAHSNETNSNDK